MEHKSKQRFRRFQLTDDFDEFSAQYAMSEQLVREVTGNNYGLIHNRGQAAEMCLSTWLLAAEMEQMERDNLIAPDAIVRRVCKNNHIFNGRKWDMCPECVKDFNSLPQPVHTQSTARITTRGGAWDGHEVHSYTVDGS